MGFQFNGIKPPRHFVPPLLSLRAGGEMTPLELAQIRARMKNRMGMNISLSPHPFLFILGEYQFAPTDHLLIPSCSFWANINSPLPIIPSSPHHPNPTSNNIIIKNPAINPRAAVSVYLSCWVSGMTSSMTT
ncbi:MAG: hypothetical protein RLY35_1293 [Bacteroidota bacterium]